MKKRTLFSIIVLSFILISLNTSKKPSAKKALKVLEGFCAYIPSGNTVLGKDTLSVASFFMSKGEITNLQYKEFLYYLKSHGEEDKLKIAAIDTAEWVNEYSYMDAYSEHYHAHPAYNNYPVVNITHEGAELYCEWLTMMYDTISGGELSLEFRLPDRSEWLRAARGFDDYFYTWGTSNLRNTDGQLLANFSVIGAEHITRNTETGKLEVTKEQVPLDFYAITETVDVLAPSESYWPNAFGIYNMNGNAAEMIANSDSVVGGSWRSPGFDIRNESIAAYTGASQTIGFRIVASYVKEVK